MKRYKTGVIALLLAGAWASTASADYLADIHHKLDSKVGNKYTFSFTVENESTDPSTAALDAFLISLDAGNFKNYSNASWLDTNGWATSVQFDGGPPADWILPIWLAADDSILGSAGGGIAKGASLGGFKFSFDYTGSLDASNELFNYTAWFGTELDGAGGYSTAAEVYGITQPTSSGQVPEPATMLLMGTGLAGLINSVRKRKEQTIA